MKQKCSLANDIRLTIEQLSFSIHDRGLEGVNDATLKIVSALLSNILIAWIYYMKASESFRVLSLSVCGSRVETFDLKKFEV